MLGACRRFLSSGGGGVFDRRAKVLQRGAAALRSGEQFDQLRDAVALMVVDRLSDLRVRAEVVGDVGSGSGHTLRALLEDRASGGASRSIREVVLMEPSQEALFRDVTGTAAEDGAVETVEEAWEAEESLLDLVGSSSGDVGVVDGGVEGVKAQKPSLRVVRRVCEESDLAVEDGSLDGVLSVLSLHWVNDLEAAMKAIRRKLRPGGFFLGAMFGGETIHELRTSLTLADLERRGGVWPRVSPMVQAPDAGRLLQAAGLELPTVDTGFIHVDLPHAIAAMEMLQDMGEGNAANGRQTAMGAARDTLLAAAAIHQTLFPAPKNPSVDMDPRVEGEQQAFGQKETTNTTTTSAAATTPSSPPPSPPPPSSPPPSTPRVKLTFEVLFLIGWAPAPDSPKPIPRGSVPSGFARKET